MNVRYTRRVPWTCEWGRFGVITEQVTASQSRVDEVFWACHHPVLAAAVRPLAREDCEHCPMWAPAERLFTGQADA